MNAIRVMLVCALIGLAALPGIAARAQDATPEPFPRRLADHSGALVVIPERPLQVAVLSQVPPLLALLAPREIASLEPDTPADSPHWEAIGLLVIPEESEPPAPTSVGYPELPKTQTILQLGSRQD